MNNLLLKCKILTKHHLIKYLFVYFRIKLAQSANKYTDGDIDYFIKECSDILGITQKIDNKGDPKAILSYVFNELASFKKFNP